MLHVVGLDIPLRGTRFDLSGMSIELRSMPWTLDGSAHQHTIGQRPALMRAAILEGDVSLARASNRDARAADAYELHLVDVETVRRFFDRLRILPLEMLFLPLACIRVAMIDADLISGGQCAAHPAPHAQRCRACALNRERDRAAAISPGEPS